MQNLPTMTKG